MRHALTLILLSLMTISVLANGEIRNQRDLLQGADAAGRIGDIRLANDRVEFVFSAIDHPMYRESTGGSLIDAALVENGEDRLGGLRTVFGQGLGIRPVNTSIELSRDREAITVEGHDPDKTEITFRTEYRLAPDWNGLIITTELTNGTDEVLTDWDIGDMVHWGSTRLFLMDRGPVFHQAVRTSTRAAIAYGPGYGLAITIGENRGMTVQTYPQYTKLAHSRDTVQPGETIVTTRHLIIGEESMDTLAEAIWEINGVAHGTLRGIIVEQGTNTPIEGAELLINSREARPVPIFRVLTDENGEFEVEVPAGVRVIGFPRSFSRTQPTQTVLPTVIEEGSESYQQYLLNPPARIDLRVTDSATGEPLPVRVALYDLNGAPADLGPVNGGRAAGPYVFVPEGEGMIEVPVGRYRVTVTHGFEHDQFEQEMIFFSGRTRELHFELERLFDTPGYVAADLGGITNRSSDGMVEPIDRVRSAVCADIEFMVATDSQVVTDLGASLTEEAANWPITLDLGERIPADVDGNYGTHAVYPVPQSRAGESVLAGREFEDPRSLTDALREILPDSLIACLNPMREGESHFLTRGYYRDPRTRNYTCDEPILPEDFDVDLFEVVSNLNSDQMRMETDLAYYLMLQGHHFSLIGSPNSRYTALEEIGSVRTYVAADDSDPAHIDPAEVYASLREGNTVVTSGPFVDFSMMGNPPGSVVQWEAGEPLELELEILCASHFPLSHVDVNKDGTFVQRHSFLTRPGSGLHRWQPPEANRKIIVRGDEFVNIEVAGGRPIQPINPANDMGRGFVGFAVTTPIWIDTDGNGVYDSTVDPEFE